MMHASRRLSRCEPVLLAVLLCGIPNTAHASDMGMVVPMLLTPVNVAIGVLFFAFGYGMKASPLASGPGSFSWGVYLFCAFLGSMCALISFQYLVRGDYADIAAGHLASFAWLIASGVYARMSKRPAED